MFASAMFLYSNWEIMSFEFFSAFLLHFATVSLAPFQKWPAEFIENKIVIRDAMKNKSILFYMLKEFFWRLFIEWTGS